jgi:hypothetical protein
VQSGSSKAPVCATGRPSLPAKTSPGINSAANTAALTGRARRGRTFSLKTVPTESMFSLLQNNNNSSTLGFCGTRGTFYNI